jgi:hypothetical protein
MRGQSLNRINAAAESHSWYALCDTARESITEIKGKAPGRPSVKAKVTTSIFVGVVCALLTASIAATTVSSVVNSDPTLCGDLLSVVNNSGIATMPDDQLCDLKFASISSARAHGFHFPNWSVFPVTNDAEMYAKMIASNRSKHSKASIPDYARAESAVKQAVEEKNLSFYIATVPVGEWTLERGSLTPLYTNIRQVTFVSMELNHCSRQRLAISAPYYASFTGPNLKTPIPAISDTSSAELVLWGAKPYLISVRYSRPIDAKSPPSPLVIMLNNLWWASGNGNAADSGLVGATKCMYRIEK